jgi:hypothetical protein
MFTTSTLDLVLAAGPLFAGNGSDVAKTLVMFVGQGVSLRSAPLAEGHCSVAFGFVDSVFGVHDSPGVHVSL